MEQLQLYQLLLQKKPTEERFGAISPPPHSQSLRNNQTKSIDIPAPQSLRKLVLSEGALPNSAPQANELPSAIEKDKVEKDKEKSQRIREEVIKEIIATERDYISDLNVIVEVFLFPIKLKKTMPIEDVNIIFSNVETLVNCNTQVIKDWDENKRLNSTKDDASIIGDIFDKMSPYFKMYSVYCANQPNAMLKLQEYGRKPEFIQTMKVCTSDPRSKGQPLGSLLIKPIQRICKYPLLFRELLKQIDPTDEKFQTLVNCAKKIESVTEYINEGKRVAEKLQRIVDIQNSILDAQLDLVTITRRFVQEGNMQLSIDNGEVSDCHIFLFNDLFVITKEKKKGFELRGQVSLEDARIVNIADTEEMKNAFEVSVGKKVISKYTLIAPTVEEKASWLKELKLLKKEFQIKQAKGEQVIRKK